MPSPGTLSVRAEQVEIVEETCGLAECGTLDPTLQIELILLTAILALGVLATLREVSKAGAVVAEERERTRAERDAFAAFERRLGSLETAHPISIHQAGPPVSLETERSDSQLDRVKNAYAETIMAVSHFEEEYDEPMEVNMTAELGEEAAVAVFDGPKLTPQLKTVLLRQTNEARTRREGLLDALDREEDRLNGAENKLRDIESEFDQIHPLSASDPPFDELKSRWERLDTLETACQSFLDEHQITTGELPGYDYEDRTIREYLYGELSTQHPVLSDGIRLIARIRERRRTTLRALTRRV